jgi:hypothetical protein
MDGSRFEALGVGILVGVIGLALAGCARARAVAPNEVPLLEAPPAPPRVVTPPGDSAARTGIEETASVSDAPVRPRPAPARPAPTAQSDRAPEAPPTDEAPPADEAPLRTLQTPASGSSAERDIRAELARAAARLREVDYRGLTRDLQGQFDTAERFVQQAHEALGARNLVYAATLAEKAAEIAEALPRR